MTDDRTRHDTVVLHGGGHRDLHGEDAGLHFVDAGDRLRRQDGLGDREVGFGGDQRLDLCDRRGEDRLGGHQSGAHLGPLRPLPGEHPHRAPIVVADSRLQRAVTGGERAQAIHQSGAVPRDHGGAQWAVPAPATERVGEIAEGQIGAGALHPVGQPRRGVTQLLSGRR